MDHDQVFIVKKKDNPKTVPVLIQRFAFGVISYPRAHIHAHSLAAL